MLGRDPPGREWLDQLTAGGGRGDGVQLGDVQRPHRQGHQHHGEAAGSGTLDADSLFTGFVSSLF